MRVETFFIGPGKCGTSWIHEYLRLHPSVAVPSIKEPNYWIEADPKGLDRYHQLWVEAPGTRACEVSNTYCFHEAIPGRLRRYNQDAHIVVTVRDPVERLASRYLFMRRNGVTRRPLKEVLVEHPELLAHCRYVDVARPWLDTFPRGQVHLLLLEELRADPETYARKLCSLLDVDYVDPRAVPKGARLGAARPRSVLLARFVKEVALWARRARLFRLLDGVKRSPLVRLLYSPMEYDAASVVTGALSPEELDDLWAQWHEIVGVLDPSARKYLPTTHSY